VVSGSADADGSLRKLAAPESVAGMLFVVTALLAGVTL
jgi:hypothetical protein